MIAAVIALAITVAAALGVIAYLARSLLSGLKSERASLASEILAGKERVVAERAQWNAEKQRDVANDERDEARAAQKKAELERDDAKAALAAADEALDKALKENIDATVTKIRSAATSELAADGLRELLQATARGSAMPADGDAAASAGDDRHQP